MNRFHSHSRSAIRSLCACVAVQIGLIVMLSGCALGSAGSDPDGIPDYDNAPPPAEAISFSDVANEPGRYAGALVTLQGTISQIISPASFVLADPTNASNSVLVLTNTPDTAATAGNPRGVGTILEVTGNIQTKDLNALTRDYSITEQQLAGYGGNAVLAAKYTTAPGVAPTAAP